MDLQVSGKRASISGSTIGIGFAIAAYLSTTDGAALRIEVGVVSSMC